MSQKVTAVTTGPIDLLPPSNKLQPERSCSAIVVAAALSPPHPAAHTCSFRCFSLNGWRSVAFAVARACIMRRHHTITIFQRHCCRIRRFTIQVTFPSCPSFLLLLLLLLLPALATPPIIHTPLHHLRPCPPSFSYVPSPSFSRERFQPSSFTTAPPMRVMHVTRHTSHTRHASQVTHTSHTTRHTSHVMPRISVHEPRPFSLPPQRAPQRHQSQLRVVYHPSPPIYNLFYAANEDDVGTHSQLL